MFALTDLFSVAGRTALVTGGATGSAAICAEALLSAGARVLIASRKGEACEEAARELSAIGPCEGFGGTVASEAGVAALAAEVRRRTRNCTSSSTTRASVGASRSRPFPGRAGSG